MFWHKYVWATTSFGLIRNMIVASMIPMKQDELYTQRIGSVCLYSTMSPFLWPAFVCSDISNAERLLRGMKPKPLIPFYLDKDK